MEVFVSHRNARLTVHGRRLLVERVAAGRPVAHVAAEMGVSRPPAYKWLRRWQQDDLTGLYDRPSRPHTTPHRTPDAVEARVATSNNRRPITTAPVPATVESRSWLSTSVLPAIAQLAPMRSSARPSRSSTSQAMMSAASYTTRSRVTRSSQMT
jgi:transposase-like protein